MKFSRKLDYGILLLGALRDGYRSGRFFSVRKVAKKEKIPGAFAEKLAEILRKHHYLEARRGKDGGYRMIRNPRHITFAELIKIFEEPKMVKCLKSPYPKKYCPLVDTCPSRKVWRDIDRQVTRVFEKVTLDQVVK